MQGHSLKKWNHPVLRQISGPKKATFVISISSRILLIDSWTDQAAIDAHHASPMMAGLAALREKYDLHMTVERFVSEDIGADEKFIRK